MAHLKPAGQFSPLHQAGENSPDEEEDDDSGSSSTRLPPRPVSRPPPTLTGLNSKNSRLLMMRTTAPKKPKFSPLQQEGGVDDQGDDDGEEDDDGGSRPEMAKQSSSWSMGTWVDAGRQLLQRALADPEARIQCTMALPVGESSQSPVISGTNTARKPAYQCEGKI